MKRIIAISAFVLMLASIIGCSAVIPLSQEYSPVTSVHSAGISNPNEYARIHADAIDRACHLTRLQYRKVFKAYWHESKVYNRHIESPRNDMRLDRSYIREHGRLERKMSRILTSEQYNRWRRIEKNRIHF